MSNAVPLPLGPQPTAITCPSCQAKIMTTVKVVPTIKTHIIAVVLCVFGWSCCCCFYPYCFDCLQGYSHYCPNCGAYLGIYDK